MGYRWICNSLPTRDCTFASMRIRCNKRKKLEVSNHIPRLGTSLPYCRDFNPASHSAKLLQCGRKISKAHRVNRDWDGSLFWELLSTRSSGLHDIVWLSGHNNPSNQYEFLSIVFGTYLYLSRHYHEKS